MTHELQDAISLELARRVAARLRVSPGLLEVARANLARWTLRNADSPSLVRCYAEWQSILRSPVDDICDLLLAETEDAQRLRQNSPFVGILAPAEVWEVKHRLRLHATTPA
jgi:Arc/MetJ family transcription regulator